MYEGGNTLKTPCQRCNDYVTFSSRSVELLYINFLHEGINSLGVYPKNHECEVHSTMISLGSHVSGFIGNRHTQKLNKSQTK